MRTIEKNESRIDATRLFLNNLGRHPLITSDREIELGTLIQKGIDLLAADLTAQGIDRRDGQTMLNLPIENLSQDDKRIVLAARRAKKRLIESNLRLVVSIAKKACSRYPSQELMDLIQEGAIGLDRGAEKFDPTKGWKFSTYAHWWILQAITRAIHGKTRSVRLPIHVSEKINKVRQVRRAFYAANGQDPSRGDLLELTDFTESQLDAVLANEISILSLDAQLKGDDGDECDLMSLQFGSTPDPIDDAIANEIEDIAHRLLSVLPDKQQTILKLRYGMIEHEHTFSEIGRVMGVSRQRILQIESKAIRSLRARSVAFRNGSQFTLE